MVANAGDAKLRLPESRAGQGFCRILTIQSWPGARGRGYFNSIKAAKIAGEREPLENEFQDCTKFWQAPVDGLHSIENRPDRVANF